MFLGCSAFVTLVTVLIFEFSEGRGVGIIPGDGCGHAGSPFTHMDKLPEDPSELAALSCVLTTDMEGVRRFRDARPRNGK